MQNSAVKLGIIAGGGSIPRQLVTACKNLQRPFFLMCLEGQADPSLTEGLPHAWIHLGAGQKLKQLVAEHGIGEIVMIGRVRRPSLLELKPDWLALKVVTRIGINMLGDDAFLRSVSHAIEEETGAKIIAVQDVMTDYLTPAGLLGKVDLDDDARLDMQRGLEVAQILGQADVGQSVVVQQGLVLGVEAIEGTDALIVRCGELQRDGVRGILVKTAKPQQDDRFDLPTIGPDTVQVLVDAGLRGIVMQAGRSLLVDRMRTIEMADTAGIFIYGHVRESDHGG